MSWMKFKFPIEIVIALLRFIVFVESQTWRNF